MNETIRTGIYVGVAAVVALLAWASRPRLEQPKDLKRELVNKPLFEDFTDPLAARSLEIVKFDEDSAALDAFKVAQKSGRWVIPSHGDYPADAETQLRDAATSLVGLTVLDIATESASDHALFGVLEPDRTKLKVGDEGVGTLVAMQDEKDNDLVRLIVGKEVDRSPGQRFVRKPSEEVVYVAKISLDKLPTEFDKWIEKDLLKLNSFDVSRVALKDYSVLPSQGGQYVYSPRAEASIAWSTEQSSWNLEKLVLHSRSGPREAGLGEQEELNSQKLDDLKTALDDLKIVDVARKPEGLGSSLRAGAELLQNQAQISTLVAFGFIPVPAQDSEKVEIYASNGEVAIETRDGVQYVLRFGNIEGAEKSDQRSEAEKADPAAKDEVKLNRYLFVTAQLAPSVLQPPVLQEVPAGPDAPKPAGETTPPLSNSGGGGAEQIQDGKAQPADANTAPPATDGKAPADGKAPPGDPASAEQERLKLENQRKMDEYREKRKKAEAKVAELNARFADWYYVISEDVYKKVHLTRSDIVKEGATARDEGFNVDAFRKLETEGIRGAVAPSTSSTPPLFPM